jgi:vesicle transport protein SEC22
MKAQSWELRKGSQRFLNDIKHLNMQAMYRKYGPPVAIITLLVLVFWARYYFF